METPFYHDDVLNVHQAHSFYTFGTMMKKDLNLNLTDQVVANLKPLRDGDGILTSPDLGLLKLASPELERLIIQSNGLVTTTPTTSQFLYPKVASEEQEFAEGFVKALEDLHKQNQLGVPTTGVDLSSVPSGGSLQPPPPSDAPIYANLNSYSSGTMGTTVNYSTDTVPYPPPPSGLAQQPAPPPPRMQILKDEPQIVPEIASFGDSPPMSPIDMDTQERIKAERKRLRNRIAASKCRKRKLERISRLEEKVKSLKSQNTELASTANLLREQVAQLKQKVMSHVNSGCQLIPQQVQAY
ncbi:PREDICTED: transcription factor jun-D [Nanorana parkeri]|uniref:transcription factor jun-D n=1 Tax=Nanorana parkeri TaxID=125878 RepID=UPI00085433D7|nr:PREDICTED: transcription factor jun-D [Nanorana parkeri]